MKVTSSRTLAAANASAGTSGGCGYALSMYSRIGWLSQSVPVSVRMNGILASGEASRMAGSFDPVFTSSSLNAMPFSSSASLTLL